MTILKCSTNDDGRLRDIQAWGQDVWQWPHIQVGDQCGLRIYYKVRDPAKGNGFDFAVAEWRGGNGLDDPECRAARLAGGTAYYDGIRHAWIGDDKGYVYCPDMAALIAVMSELRKLEIAHCWMEADDAKREG